MTSELVFGMLVHLDPIQIKFEGHPVKMFLFGYGCTFPGDVRSLYIVNRQRVTSNVRTTFTQFKILIGCLSSSLC